MRVILINLSEIGSSFEAGKEMRDVRASDASLDRLQNEIDLDINRQFRTIQLLEPSRLEPSTLTIVEPVITEADKRHRAEVLYRNLVQIVWSFYSNPLSIKY